MGQNWRIPNVRGKRAIRHVLFDTNFWKSFVHARLAVATGDRGCLSLCGSKAAPHRLFAEHLTAEYRVKTEGRGRTVDEWKIRPEQPDNHSKETGTLLMTVYSFQTSSLRQAFSPACRMSNVARLPVIFWK